MRYTPAVTGPDDNETWLDSSDDSETRLELPRPPSSGSGTKPVTSSSGWLSSRRAPSIMVALAAGETPSPEMVAAAGASDAIGAHWVGFAVASDWRGAHRADVHVSARHAHQLHRLPQTAGRSGGPDNGITSLVMPG